MAVGDEGGFAPNLESNAAALALISEAVSHAGYKLGNDITLALDCAASEFYQDGRYNLAGGKGFSASEFADYLAALVMNIQFYRLKMEWMKVIGLLSDLTNKIGQRVQLVGDDFCDEYKNITARH